MKRSIILLIISFIMVFTGMIHAQGRRGDRIPPIPNDEQIQKMVDELSGKLNLTDEQKSRIENLYREHFETIKKLHEQKEISPEKMESLRKELDSKIKALLKKEQQKQYDEYMKNHRPQGRAGRRPGQFRGKE